VRNAVLSFMDEVTQSTLNAIAHHGISDLF
jgi:hypothetical protein